VWLYRPIGSGGNVNSSTLHRCPSAQPAKIHSTHNIAAGSPVSGKVSAFYQTSRTDFSAERLRRQLACQESLSGCLVTAKTYNALKLLTLSANHHANHHANHSVNQKQPEDDRI
jgi:hypothetical protein